MDLHIELFVIIIVVILLGLAGRWDSQEVPEQPTQHELEYYSNLQQGE